MAHPKISMQRALILCALTLVGDFEDGILEIGTGATFVYYGQKSRLSNLMTKLELLLKRLQKNADTKIKVIPCEGERLPFKNKTFNSISTSLALCINFII